MAWKGSGVQFPLAPRFNQPEVSYLVCLRTTELVIGREVREVRSARLAKRKLIHS